MFRGWQSCLSACSALPSLPDSARWDDRVNIKSASDALIVSSASVAGTAEYC